MDEPAGENKEGEEKELARMALSLVEESARHMGPSTSKGTIILRVAATSGSATALCARLAEFRALRPLAIFLLNQYLDPIGFRQ